MSLASLCCRWFGHSKIRLWEFRDSQTDDLRFEATCSRCGTLLYKEIT